MTIEKKQILPLVLILIDIGAAAGYIPSGEYKRVLYWFSAALLTWSVSF
jgi:hypothetical protein